MKYTNDIEINLKKLGIIPGLHVYHINKPGSTYIIQKDWYEVLADDVYIVTHLASTKTEDGKIKKYDEKTLISPENLVFKLTNIGSDIPYYRDLVTSGFVIGAYIKCAGDDYKIMEYVYDKGMPRLRCIKNGDKYGIYYLNPNDCTLIENITRNFDTYEIF